MIAAYLIAVPVALLLLALTALIGALAYSDIKEAIYKNRLR